MKKKIKSNIFYILPCYNEELNLNKLLKDFINFYKKKIKNYNFDY